VWTIAYAGTTVRLRDTRGVRYLARLLHAPGQEVHASELVGARSVNGRAVAEDRDTVRRSLGDAGALLDRRAHAEYRRRLVDLRADLEEAQRLNDLGRAARAREEIAALGRQLAAGMRGRRAASHAERARLTVTKGIKAALERIAASHPVLGRHLAATVRRGYFCVYRLDPRQPIRWEG
jgi:non-specific serine/threonine protein kinase